MCKAISRIDRIYENNETGSYKLVQDTTYIVTNLYKSYCNSSPFLTKSLYQMRRKIETKEQVYRDPRIGSHFLEGRI